MNEILKYFPELSEEQICQLKALEPLYKDWNSKINVISRKDIDNLYLHHVLHSMAIAKFVHFRPGTRILDFGTGGGFPGIPLAILFPEARFTLIDGTAKKIMVAQAVADAIHLHNVRAEHLRGEDDKRSYDFVVSRAVMPMNDLMKIVRKRISPTPHNSIANGVISLKGGDLTEELRNYHHIAEVEPLSQWFEEEWFVNKNIVYIPC